MHALVLLVPVTLIQFALGAVILTAIRGISGRWSLIAVATIGYWFFVAPLVAFLQVLGGF